MDRCRKGVFGKYCFLRNTSTGEITWCMTYTACEDSRKVTPERVKREGATQYRGSVTEVKEK